MESMFEYASRFIQNLCPGVKFQHFHSRVSGMFLGSGCIYQSSPVTREPGKPRSLCYGILEEDMENAAPWRVVRLDINNE